MSLAEIHTEIGQITDHERRQLLQDLEEMVAEDWDRQIVEDAKAGRMDHLIAEADADIKAGRVRELS